MPTPEETPTPEAQNQEPAQTPEETPTPEAQDQEQAPIPEETPTPETQDHEPAADKDATGAIRPVLTFKQTAWSANETDADGALTITANVNPALTAASAVSIVTSPNATGDARVPSTLALPAGQTSVDLPITIIGDDDAEDDESFGIELSATDAAPYTVGEPAKTTITIIDDDSTELTIVEAASAQGAAAAPQKEAESPSNAAQTQSDTQGATPQNQQDGGAGSGSAPQTQLSQTAWSAREGDGALDITVNISPALSAASAVNITPRYNDAASAADVSLPATLTLPQGATSATLRINIIDDSLVEGDESFRIVLSAIDNAPYKVASRKRYRRATITIIDDDRPELTISEAPAAQGAAAAPQKQAESLPSAQQGSSDSVDKELDTNKDDDLNSVPDLGPKLSLSQTARSAGEGDGALDITVNISPALPAASAVNITPRYNGAASAADVSLPATLTLPQGATSATLRINITDDSLVEGAESFDIELSAVEAAPYTLGQQATTTITINDNDRSFVSIDSSREIRLNETDADFTRDITVRIKPALSITSTVKIVVEWNDGSKVRAPATLTLPKGATSVNLPITIIGDSVAEGVMKVRVKLSAVEGEPYKVHGEAALTGVTIWINDDDDNRHTLTLGQAAYTVSETDGDVTKNITVRLNQTLYGGAREVNITTRHISTTAADVTVPETFTLPSNHQGRTLSRAYTFPITIHGDDAVEGAESFEIELSAAAGARYALGQPFKTIITINDDDFATLALAQAAYTVNEGDGALHIPVKINPALANASAVNVTIRHISTAAADVSVPATLTLPAGQTSVDLQIPITADNLVEEAEKLEIKLSAVADAPYKLGQQAKTAITINDDDFAALAFSQAAWSATEADSDGTLNLTVNINPALPAAGAVNITTRHISTAAADVTVPVTLTLPAGQTSVELPITISGDDAIEGDESFEIKLSAVADAPYKLGQQAKTAITINDDDFAALAFSQAAWSATEADSDGTLNLTVNINPALPAAGAVNITTRYDSATADDVSVPATLTLPAGQTSVELPITISGDDAIEGDESFEIELVAVEDALYTLGDPGKATITIKDDDQPSPDASALSRSAWTITVTPGDQKLDVSWQAPPGVAAGEISQYRVIWCLEVEDWGCNPTTRLVFPAVDGSGSYTITRHFAPNASPSWASLINGARYRVYVRAMRDGYTSLATSEFSYDNRPQAPGDKTEN